jgi:hypothetical protein
VSQIDYVRVSAAADISQTFMLKLAGAEIHGSPIGGQVSLAYTGDMFNVFITEECGTAEFPPYELVSLIADAFEIKDPTHFTLLYTALSNSSMEAIVSTFDQQGIYVKGLVLGMLLRFVSYDNAYLWTQISRKINTEPKEGI